MGQAWGNGPPHEPSKNLASAPSSVKGYHSAKRVGAAGRQELDWMRAACCLRLNSCFQPRRDYHCAMEDLIARLYPYGDGEDGLAIRTMKLRQNHSQRRHFTWILGGHEAPDKTKSIVIRLHTALNFQIVVAKPTSPDIYFENVDEFLGETAIANDLPFGAVGIRSDASTAALSGTHTLEQDPILLEQETLGRGAYGVVTRVWDVSTGREYALKRFTNLDKSDWEKEASLMRQSPHELPRFARSDAHDYRGRVWTA
ncbi:hypothetical protein LTR17_027236 [Elasticomyces elasticus]|nr:hypothetical protein LTR17_027236 [Elasticomyces elasticus]